MAFQTLTELFTGGRAAGHPVAWVEGGLRTWADLQADAARVSARVRREGGQRWVLACADAWAFTAGFLGLVQAGRCVVLPPNLLPDTLARLDLEADGRLQELPTAAGSEPAPVAGASVEFWTSGSTGEPKAIRRSLAQLDAEVALLEDCFGALLRAAPVAGTVPHFHIYGCLFRILWPLAAGRPLLAEPCGDPAGFRQACLRAPGLVSSPAHLARLPELMDLEQLPALPVAVFSSGGPLGRAEALAWRRWVAAGVVEIYGSTESGGIAWRCQDADPDSALWTPFADVTLTLAGDGALQVAGMRAGPGLLRLEDAAEWVPDGRFRLLGRLDRTVKLEEKRVSLPELEAALETHPLVARAAVLLLQGRRPVLGAAVVLREPVERAAAVEALRRHLAGRFEPVALPKRWRFPRALPYDARGKLTVRALADLFAAKEVGP